MQATSSRWSWADSHQRSCGVCLAPAADAGTRAALPTVQTITAFASYRELLRRPDTEPGPPPPLEMLPPAEEVFLAMPGRWKVAMPEWNRYGRKGEYPFVRKSHWWDPFNRNRLKGDEPIFGQQTFLNITATADTNADGRRVPVPSNISAVIRGRDRRGILYRRMLSSARPTWESSACPSANLNVHDPDSRAFK